MGFEVESYIDVVLFDYEDDFCGVRDDDCERRLNVLLRRCGW